LLLLFARGGKNFQAPALRLVRALVLNGLEETQQRVRVKGWCGGSEGLVRRGAGMSSHLLGTGAGTLGERIDGLRTHAEAARARHQTP
jgi:hypothetical protein